VKYMMLLIRSDDDWEALTDEERDYAAIHRFWREAAAGGAVVGGHQLHPARTATTVSWPAGSPVVTDGPFMESKETIGGYGILDVPDLDAALAIARRWPARGHRVEIRPVVEEPG
jgi:hypothetical protein